MTLLLRSERARRRNRVMISSCGRLAAGWSAPRDRSQQRRRGYYGAKTASWIPPAGVNQLKQLNVESLSNFFPPILNFFGPKPVQQSPPVPACPLQKLKAKLPQRRRQYSRRKELILSSCSKWRRGKAGVRPLLRVCPALHRVTASLASAQEVSAEALPRGEGSN